MMEDPSLNILTQKFKEFIDSLLMEALEDLPQSRMHADSSHNLNVLLIL